MNYLLIFFLILVVMLMIVGYSRGMVKEIISFVTLILLSSVATLMVIGITNYTKGKIVHVMAVVLLAAVIGIVHRVLNVIFISAKFIADLPVVEWLDKVMGIATGALESVVILWMGYVFVMFGDLGLVTGVVMQYVRASMLLTWLYEHNYLAHYIEPLYRLFT